MLVFVYNVWVSRNNPKVEVDDPWGYGASLEWATSCPPPRHNFVSMPRIRSERPAFDLHHPEAAAAGVTPPDTSLLARVGGGPDLKRPEGRPGDGRR
jgi:cytochrome c oxidase subunit 1